MNAVFRWVVPVDDDDHIVLARGEVGHVAAAYNRELGMYYVEFWTFPENPAGSVLIPRSFRVFGTGQPIPDGYHYRGTAPRSEHALVWHLFERLGGGVSSHAIEELTARR